MTIFQKLFWLTQMGIDSFCSENKHLFLDAVQTGVKKKEPLSVSSQSALSKTAMHPLQGIGVRPAKVLCILNAPNAQEDRTGDCLVGPEGEMLKKMLASVGLDLETNSYLTYLSPWRPPGNRLLTSVEVKECLGILDKTLAQVCPTYLFVFGAETLRSLIPGKTLSAVRSGHCTYQNYPVYATFSAADLIKNPAHKRQAWEDLKSFQKRITDA